MAASSRRGEVFRVKRVPSPASPREEAEAHWGRAAPQGRAKQLIFLGALAPVLP